ncbi:MAG: AAA family ATPase [Gemmatimonadetes bacterium]|nr:AAA family ATPase [Gemmatimonadota bacterium]
MVVCDVSVFKQLCEGGKLGRALAVLECGFLSGLPSSVSRGLEEWIDERSAHFKLRLQQKAEGLWVEAEQRADWAKASEAANVVWALEPWNQGSLRNLMRAHAMCGRTGAAIDALEQHRKRIREMGRGDEIEPETIELGERVRALGFLWPAKRAESRRGGPRFCGREREVSIVRHALFSRKPDLRLITVRGEGGIGKSRLVEECLKEAQSLGCLVLSSRAAELEREIPFNALLEALRGPGIAEEVQALSEPWRAVLLGLMPDFAADGGLQIEVPSVHPGALQRRLLEAIRQFFMMLAHRQPVVLFLDDFHWADDTSVTALEYLRRRWAAGSFAVVMAMRPEELHAEAAVCRFLRALEDCQAHVAVDVDELGEDAAVELVKDVAKGGRTVGDVSKICTLGRGNPFFLIELTLEGGRAWQRGGTIDLDAVSLPLSVSHVLRERVGRLSRSGRAVIGALAVWGRPVTLRAVGWVARVWGKELVSATEELAAARLVEWSGGRLGPRHELIRQSVYRGLGEATRAWLHDRSARYLMRGRLALRAEEIALHCDRAGDRENALKFARDAAKRAEDSGAVLEAMHFLSIAQRNAKSAEEAVDILGQLGKLRYLQLDFAGAAPLLDFAVQRYRSEGRRGERLAAEVWRVDALSRSGSFSMDHVLEQLRAIKLEAQETEQWEALAVAVDVEWHLLDRLGAAAALERLLAEGEKCAMSQSARAGCIGHRSLAIIHQYYGDPEAALRHCVAGVQLARAEGLQDELLRNLNARIVVLLQHGLLETAEGRAARDSGEALAARSGDLFFRYNVRANIGVWFLDIGELEKAQAFFGEGERIIGEAEARSVRALLYVNLGELYYEMRRIEESRDYYRRLLDLPGAQLWYTTAMTHAGLGLCAVHMGDLREMRKQEELLSSALRGHPKWANDPSMIVRFEAQLAHRRGSTEGAVELLNDAAAVIRRRQVPNWIKLKLEAARMLAKISKAEAAATAREAYEVAAALNLERRCQQLQAFL